jgi:hypothetical protein
MLLIFIAVWILVALKDAVKRAAALGAEGTGGLMKTITRRTGTVRKTAHDPGDPLVTSHCPFCGSGQVVGRSDGTIGCDFCGQSYIVRVQPAFPGMPQMPTGPGAPSDVGPDGGLVDPGMIGPDGAPMDGGGPPPGEDAEPGGGPQDDAADGGGDFPPSGGGSDDDASASGPPEKGDSGKSKGKSKKKSSLRSIALRRYQGLEGQLLTEDQLVRHVAVRASGADPRVMRVLRASSARRVTADDGTPVPYRTLGSGHQVTVGRNSAGWYGEISPPAPHTQAHYMDLGYAGTRDDAHMLADLHLQRGPARDFVRSTTSDLGEPARGYSSPEWHRGPGAGTAPSEWRPAQASRGRRPFGRTAMQVEHNHGDMSPDVLRHHMRDRHGFLDSLDDPDWLVDETHRNEHADAPLEHVHPDLDTEYDDDIHLGDRDWMNQHGIGQTNGYSW